MFRPNKATELLCSQYLTIMLNLVCCVKHYKEWLRCSYLYDTIACFEAGISDKDHQLQSQLMPQSKGRTKKTVQISHNCQFLLIHDISQKLHQNMRRVQ